MSTVFYDGISNEFYFLRQSQYEDFFWVWGGEGEGITLTPRVNSVFFLFYDVTFR